MEGVRLDKNDLIRRFKISNRLAVRIGALLANKVDLTAAVIETAASDGALESFLCSREMLDAAHSLTDRSLKALMSKQGVSLDSPLAVLQQKGWRTIALEEEVLAEEGWKRAEEEQAHLPVPRRGELTRPGIFEEDEETARLKLSAMTSTDPGERAAAVQKLMYAPLPAARRASIFFEILVDPISRGRAEAIAGLEAMGFSRDAGESLRELLEGKEQDKTFAIGRLGSLLKKLDEPQAVVVAAALLTALRDTESVELERDILGALRQTAGILVKNPPYVSELIRLCLKGIQSNPSVMVPSARTTIQELVEADRKVTMRVLWDELGKSVHPRIRAFLMTLLAQLKPEREKLSDLAKLMAAQLRDDKLSESERLILGQQLATIDEPAIAPLLEILDAGDETQSAFVVPLLDRIAVEGKVSRAAKNRIAERLLQSLKVGERRVRMAILQARVCWGPDLSSKLKSDLAAEFIHNAPDFPFPDMCNEIDSALENMGREAVGPLFDYVKRHPYDEISDRMIRVLGRIVETLGGEGAPLPAETKDVIKLCLARLRDDKVRFGGYVFALGAICSGPAGSPDFCDKLLQTMLNRMWKAPYTADFFNAIGRLAASEHVSAGPRASVTDFFLRIISNKRIETLAKERKTEDGTVFEFGRDSEMDTVLLPEAINSAGRICLSRATSDECREQILRVLLKAWGEAAGWKVIWGPSSTEALARALGAVASSDMIPMEIKLKIGRTMKPHLAERLSVVRAIGEICSQEVSSPELDELSLSAVDEIIAEWMVPESEDEERSIILKVLTRMVAREALNPRSSKVRKARERVIELLFDGLRENLDGCLDCLYKMKDCKGLTKKQRAMLEDRLRAATSIVKTSSRSGRTYR